MLKSVVFALILIAKGPLAHAQLDVTWLGAIGVQDGVTSSSVKDQKSGEICWSYSMAALAESSYRKLTIASALKQDPTLKRADLEADEVHRSTHISPEYLQFWHIYHQIVTNLKHYAKLAIELERHPNSPQSQMAMEAYGIKDPLHPNAKLDDQPDIGNDGATALIEAKLYGMVPNVVFTRQTTDHQDLAITSDAQEAELERKISDFVGEVVLKTKNIKRYRQAGHKGVNLELYSDLNSYFHSVLGLDRIGANAKIPLPSDTFEYRNMQLTPLTYMAYTGFNPGDYAAYTSDKTNQQLALQAVKAALDKNFLVPIGIEIFDDKIATKSSAAKDKDDFQKLAEREGLFWVDFCPDKKCSVDGGGHEVSAINYYFDGDDVTALIVKNSWGPIGNRDSNGLLVAPGDATNRTTGYFIVTAKYLEQEGENADAPWDFIIPKSIARDPRFAGKFEAE